MCILPLSSSSLADPDIDDPVDCAVDPDSRYSSNVAKVVDG